MQTRNKVVFITGGSAGIGFALARAFHLADNEVVICGRNTDRLRAASEQLPEVHTIQCDITDVQQVTALAERLEAEFGGLDVLVNNAGVQCRYPKFHEAEDALEQIQMEIDVNLTALVNLTHLLLPQLLARTEAAVVNMSSVLALVPREDVPVYCATKAGVHAFSMSLRRQLKSTPVRVFEVMPPEVDTEMTAYKDANKMSPDALASAVMRALAKDRYEVRAGVARTLALINRFSPRLAAYMVHN
jgi:short-subunit dehydrogenase involved in D-alanine esterification of teichoic acids